MRIRGLTSSLTTAQRVIQGIEAKEYTGEDDAVGRIYHYVKTPVDFSRAHIIARKELANRGVFQ
jgi:hypothetical protein